MEEIEKESLILREKIGLYKINAQTNSSKLIQGTMIFFAVFIGFGAYFLNSNFQAFLLFFILLSMAYALFYYRKWKKGKRITRRVFTLGNVLARKLLPPQKLKDLIKEIDDLERKIKNNPNIMKEANKRRV